MSSTPIYAHCGPPWTTSDTSTVPSSVYLPAIIGVDDTIVYLLQCAYFFVDVSRGTPRVFVLGLSSAFN